MVRKRVWLNTPWGNYTDKIKHKLNSTEIDEYKLYEEKNTHFNYGDFVNASCITKPTLVILNKLPNYMLIYNGDEIESRWFVLNYQFNAGEPASNYGVYDVTLIRDVVIDFIDIEKTQLFKCERGTLSNTWSPLLVQPEGLFLNKIKTAQLPIENWDSNTQWLTIFYDNELPEESRTITFENTDNDTDSDYTFDEMQNDFSNATYNLTTNGISNALYKRSSSSITFTTTHALWGETTYTINRNGILDINWARNPDTPAVFLAGLSWAISKFNINKENNIFQELDNTYNYSNPGYVTLRNKYDNRLVENYSNIERAIFTESTGSSNVNRTSEDNLNVLNIIYDGASSEIKDMMITNQTINTGTSVLNVSNFDVSFNSVAYTCKLILPGNYRLDELALACVTIPFGDGVKVQEGSTTLQIDTSTIKSIATSGWRVTGDAILDIQILPYCPMARLNSQFSNSTPSNNINITDILEGHKVELTPTTSEEPIYYGLVCTQSSMDYRYNIDLSEYFTDNLKLESMTKSLRLVSNDHKQIFEFNPLLNNGLNYLSISYTIKPFSTVYRICPVFNDGSLYGGNYKDSRGLIWEGGFSLSQVNDPWTEYLLNNSTYQSAFDRQVKNMEITNEGARELETLQYNSAYGTSMRNATTTLIGGVVGGITGMAASAVGGSGTGMAMSAAGMVGSVIGSANQAINAKSNLQTAKEAQSINDRLRSESINYKTDMFNLTNQAIQNQPAGLSASTEYSVLNTAKAYIEIYDCSEAEKQMVLNYLKYNGYKIDKIGYVGEFTGEELSYVRGNFLFLNRISPVVSNMIQSEFKQGIYIQGGLFNE